MKKTAALALSTLLALSGCAALSEDADTGGDGDLRVVAAFYPLHYASQRVAGGHAEVQNLTQPGGEPHDLELTVRETAELSRADLVVYESGFQPAVDESIEQNVEGEVVDAAEVVDLLAVDESPEEHEEHDEHGEGEHGDEDPHFWHDPARMADLGDAVAEQLAEVDPDHADDYAANAEELRADLEQVDREFEEGLADCERDVVVVAHDAFGYLEKYDLHFASVAGISPDAEPTPAHLAELQRLIRDEGVTTVFAERLGPELTRSLADDLGLETAVLDSIEGLTDETDGEDYLSLMRQNLAAINEANGCRT